MNDMTKHRLQETFAIEAECLARAAEYIDEESFAKAVDLLAGAVRLGATSRGNSRIALPHFSPLICFP